jgi:hypothetical protein
MISRNFTRCVDLQQQMSERFEFRSNIDVIGMLRLDHANEVNKDASF